MSATQLVMLDAAFPPAPDQLLADMDQVGAQACAVYVWGGASRGWTPAHVSALRQGGKYALPIVVPGDNPPQDTSVILAAAQAFGFSGGPLMTDYEPTSEPSASWAWLWEEAQRAAGYRPDDYGTRLVLGQYPAADADWIASWVRTGVMDPVPQLPAGELAWQFVNDVQLAHGVYDVSVVDPALFAPAPAPPAAGGDTMLRVPGAAPDSFHLFAVRSGHLVRVSAPQGGLGDVLNYLQQPGNDWVDHGAPQGRLLVAGGLAGGRGPDGQGAIRVEVHAQVLDGTLWTYAVDDAGEQVLDWLQLGGAVLDLPSPGPPGPTGPAGPPTYVRHSHQSQTDTGTPTS